MDELSPDAAYRHTRTIGETWPHLTLVLDLPSETGFERTGRKPHQAGKRRRGQEPLGFRGISATSAVDRATGRSSGGEAPRVDRSVVDDRAEAGTPVDGGFGTVSQPLLVQHQEDEQQRVGDA